MSNLDKWIDVRERHIREAIDTNITIKKLDELNCYFTVKEIYSIDENNELTKKSKFKTVDKDFKILEYTPIDKNYNVRVFVNDKNEIFLYYLDITDGMQMRDGVPFYNDLYLDVVYYNDQEKKRLMGVDNREYLDIWDKEELEEAFVNNIVTKQQYNEAHKMANQLVDEIRNGNNIYVNRGLTDYFNIKDKQ